MRDCLSQVRDHAYAHHIQRLMVTGNLALLLGVDVTLELYPYPTGSSVSTRTPSAVLVNRNNS